MSCGRREQRAGYVGFFINLRVQNQLKLLLRKDNESLRNLGGPGHILVPSKLDIEN